MLQTVQTYTQRNRVYLLNNLLISSCRSDEDEIFFKSGVLYFKLDGKRQDVKEAGRFPVLWADRHQYQKSLNESLSTALTYF